MQTTTRTDDEVLGQPATPAIDEQEAVRTHRPLVRRIAANLARRAGPVAELDDLIAAGLLGVVRAARAYNPALNVPFELFAARHARWAMLSELRTAQPMRRSVSDRRRQLRKAEERLVHRLHHAPTAAELAAELEASEAVVARWQAEIAAAERHPAFAGLTARSARAAASGLDHATGIPTPAANGTLTADRHHDDEPAAVDPLPEDIVLDLELLAALHRAIDELPERLARVVRSTYLENRRLADVATELGVTESRVSQLRTEAVTALRRALQQRDDETDYDAARTGTRVIR